jgi:predicted house-cleaning noncanonical NTP pyrophosphatase (MazG superfamily)
MANRKRARSGSSTLVELAPSGGKAEGLIRVPPVWVPNFFTISSELFERWTAEGTSNRSLLRFLSPFEKQQIDEAVLRLGPNREQASLIVRSNADDECLENRGLLESHRSDGTIEGILGAAEQVFSSAVRLGSQISTGLIVQRYVTSRLTGHLSNEFRLTRDRRRWVFEYTDNQGKLGEGWVQSDHRTRLPKDLVPRCARVRDLPTALRTVARWMYDQRKQDLRWHLEWVWDGARLWVVQADEAPLPSGQSPLSVPAYRASKNKPLNFRVLRRFNTDQNSRWQKLNCVTEFAHAQMPTTALYVLEGKDFIEAMASDGVPVGLTDDLSQLITSPIVIRTDLAGKMTLLAPRTDWVTNISQAVDFLKKTSKDLVGDGHRAVDICFIMHHFIPAVSSAFAFARPDSTRVRIDALWGIPDGLLFLPHDSFEVGVGRRNEIHRKVRFKPFYYAPLQNGKWEEQPVSHRWAWAPSISDEELREIAMGTNRLARNLGKPIQLMWFVGIPKTTGHPSLLPWRYTDEETPSHVDSAVASRFRRSAFLLSTAADLEKIRRSAGKISSIDIRPSPELLRKDDFWTELGGLAKELSVPVNLSGSPLQHIYYVLRRTGAQVACVDPIDIRLTPQPHGKLVRDKIPVRIKTRGEVAATVKVYGTDLTDVLKAKLVEEALEAFSAQEDSALIDELVDVQEVIDALRAAVGISQQEFLARAAEKRQSAGGFERGIVLVETAETPLVQVSKQDPPDSLVAAQGVAKANLKLPQPIVVPAKRRPRITYDRILVPLVPSPSSEVRGPTRLSLPNRKLGLEIFYREKVVEIIVLEEKTPADPNQLSLGFSPPRGRGE